MCIISFLCAVYYNMVIAYILRYLFASFTGTLPWTHCRDDWIRNYNCYERIKITNGIRRVGLYAGYRNRCIIGQIV